MTAVFVVEGEDNEVISTFDNKNDAINYAFEYFRTTEDDQRFNQVNVKDSDNRIIFTNFRTPTTHYYTGPMT
jgi:hypothetical protein